MRAVLPASTLLALGLALVSPARAAESDDACTHTIDELPVLIDTPGGVYCVASTLVHPVDEFAAIRIMAPDVTIDCNDHVLDGTDLPVESGAHGILADGDAAGTIVRRCDVRGFFFGISLQNGGVVEDSIVRRAKASGISVHGGRAIVRRNRVLLTGNSPTYPAAYGINVNGVVEVVDNDVVGVATGPGTMGLVHAILIGDSGASGTALVARNHVSGLNPDGDVQAAAIEIYSTGSVIARDNVLWGPEDLNSQGFYCQGSDATIITRNVVFDFGFGIYFNCTADPGNTVRD